MIFLMHNFQYIDKKSPEVQTVYNNICNILYQVQDLVRDKFTFKFYPIGSYSRNMITYDTKSKVGFDIDINIEVNDDEEEYTAKEIKTILMNALRMVVLSYSYSSPQNSTRVITIKQINSLTSRILHSCDFAIVYNGQENGRDIQQYIRFNKKTQEYSWEYQSKGYYKLNEKVQWLKKHGYWNDLLGYYIYKKNTNTNPNVHSRTVFAIAVQEMCQKYNYYRK